MNFYLPKLSRKKLLLCPAAALFAGGIYQGYQEREKYITRTKLPTPQGPTYGKELWLGKFYQLKDQLKQKVQNSVTISLDATLDDILIDADMMVHRKVDAMKLEIKAKADLIKRNLKEKLDTVGSSDKPDTKRKLKLLVLGDSLVCGVGNDNIADSPALPRLIAKVLSIALQRDVEWYSAGLIGATANDLRTKIFPKEKSDVVKVLFPSDQTSDVATLEDSELIVIIVCGLNDWKHVFETLRFSTGLQTFKDDLRKLVDDIKDLGSDLKCKVNVFLPAMPMKCGESDPSFCLKRFPLYFIADHISWFWDMQKQAVARDVKDTCYIGAPGLDKSYSTPGSGNVSADGIHPSTKGYLWFAMHIAHFILERRSFLNESSI